MNSEMPLISIIVPIYNVEKYLHKCVDSILHQTYWNLEVILVNDGSTDQSGEICEDYLKKDSRIIVLHKKNGGQGSARNRGLDICTGEYIAFLDSDDSMEIFCIEALYNYLVENDLDISSCNYAKYDEQDNFIALNEIRYGNFIVDGIEAQRKIWHAEVINLAPWGKLFKKKHWDGIRFEECRYYEDYATMHRVYLPAEKFGYLHKPEIRYLVRGNSDTKSFNELKLQTLDIADKTIKYCEDGYPEVLDAAICKAVAVYFHNCMNISQNELYYEAYNLRLKTFLNKYSSRVCRDKRGRIKTKLALYIYFISPKFSRWLYQKLKEKRGVGF